MKKIIFLVLSLFIINYFFSFATAKDEYNYETKFNPQDMREDLLFLEKTIKEVHPNPYHFTSQVIFEKKMGELFNKIDKPLTYDEFYFIVLEAIGLTKDSHTTAYYSKKQRELPIDWYCSKDGLFITKNNFFQIGDKVETIGNKSVHEIINEFKTMIPAENDYWVMSNLERRLKQEAFLRKLSLIDNDGKVRIKVKTANNITKVKKLDVLPSPVSPNDVSYSYQIIPESNLGIIYLDECINNSGYRKMLEAFFDEVQAKKISKVAIDIRNNYGGSSSVLDEFLAYTMVDEYKNYSKLIHWSEQAIQQGGLEDMIDYSAYNRKGKFTQKIIHKTNNLFKGKIYVITSKNTFSSATMVAVKLKDNNIGTVIGEPTGGAPSHYGELLRFRLPKSKIRFYVSCTTFVRPNPHNVSTTTLKPDVYIPYTRNNIVLGKDPAIDWLKAVK
ncbi:S41 family peptidase [Pelosinus sp. IPA-1]|uniref:S41 family peptidase n=1 Tax=Pelosinus sp. IPA-1 TaxID=3029569 RepID=UPI0024362613|nr:S41 family peptidase [Pelosinus sp. IPA-1]GMA98214.1 peptidase S41 [Pelosinus sp. IPA-1]